ncbi:hypothetical protein NMY22_g5357 [Coprinellus aureogranulatus]|nr:hypothetical protein NMY22_g5357 [Coprinellus aureogranulatus]
MAPVFPNEILELIVEELAISGRGPWKGLLKDLKSCCLVSKAFVPLCRRHIFRSVDLYPGRTFMSGRISIPNTTTLWAKLLDDFCSKYEAVNLGLYVCRLKYHAVLDVDSRNKLICDMLEKMPNITHLDLRVDNEYGGVDFFTVGSDWRCSLLALVQQPNLKSLSIRNFTLPVEALLRSPSLEQLDIRDSFRPGYVTPRRNPVKKGWATVLRWKYEWYDVPELHPVYPRRLRIDSMTGADTGIVPKPDDETRASSFVRLERLEDLELIVEGFYDYDTAKSVFEDTRNLRRLTLQMNLQPTEGTILPDFPLKYLNPSSFSTLTNLHVRIMNTRDWENIPLDDPYMGFCGTYLTDLTALEKLHIEVWIIDIVLPQTAYGPQWGLLDRTLVSDESSTCTLPALKEVKLDVGVKVWEGYRFGGGSLSDGRQSLDNIRSRVLPRYFPGLTGLAKKRVLSFSAEATMTVVPNHAPGSAHETDQWVRHHEW